MSAAAQLAQNSKLYIAGSAGSAEPLTAVTPGNPTIIAITGHTGVAAGDVVTLAGFTGADAALLNGKTAVAHHYTAGAVNDTFAVDIDTTGKTITIGSATATPTAWVQIKELKKIGKNGAKTSTVDTSDLDSAAKEFRTGLVDNGQISMELNDLVTDPGQQALLAAFTASTTNNFKIALNGGSTRTFAGSVTGFDTTPEVGVDGVQTISAEIKISGAVTRS